MGELIYPNGIDGLTGQSVLPTMTPEQFAQAVLGAHASGATHDAVPQPPLGAAPQPSQQAPSSKQSQRDEIRLYGWGVIFAKDADPAIRTALAPLIEHRKQEAGANFREFSGPTGYVAGDTKEQFLYRSGVQPGPSEPSEMPFHLLIVGSPMEVPFRFQEQLTVMHAVGRIHFDEVEHYERYARSVVAIETGRVQRPSGAAFFAPNHDPATELTAEHLAEPLSKVAQKTLGAGSTQTYFGHEADKSRLTELVGGAAKPGLLFSASHGLCFPSGADAQRARQGAVVCPDGSSKPLNDPSQSFAGGDVPESADLHGLVAFFFACFGVGTPKLDNFAVGSLAKQPERAEVAPEPFVGSLPKRMLSHEKGALAIVGHVDRAWQYSFSWRGRDHLDTYSIAIDRLLKGATLGVAMRTFAWRYASLSSDMLVILEDMRFGVSYPNVDVAERWTRNNDARDFVIFGDPGVRAIQ